MCSYQEVSAKVAFLLCGLTERKLQLAEDTLWVREGVVCEQLHESQVSLSCCSLNGPFRPKPNRRSSHLQHYMSFQFWCELLCFSSNTLETEGTTYTKWPGYYQSSVTEELFVLACLVRNLLLCGERAEMSALRVKRWYLYHWATHTKIIWTPYENYRSGENLHNCDNKVFIPHRVINKTHEHSALLFTLSLSVCLDNIKHTNMEASQLFGTGP